MNTPVALVIAATVAAVTFSPIGPANAASFSCMEYENLNRTEKRICRSRSLGWYDERLDSWYRRALERARYFDQTRHLRHEQRHWLKKRNRCGGWYWCIRRKYRQRIRELKNYVEHV